MQRHDDTVKTPPEAQEHGTQHPLTCHYCGRAVRRTATVEAYDRTRGRSLIFCSERCKQAARNRPDHYYRFSHARIHTILAHAEGAFEE